MPLPKRDCVGIFQIHPWSTAGQFTYGVRSFSISSYSTCPATAVFVNNLPSPSNSTLSGFFSIEPKPVQSIKKSPLCVCPFANFSSVIYPSSSLITSTTSLLIIFMSL